MNEDKFSLPNNVEGEIKYTFGKNNQKVIHLINLKQGNNVVELTKNSLMTLCQRMIQRYSPDN